MTICLDRPGQPDVAVLHGVDTDAALLHLCRSLVTGSAFDVYRALVIDLGGREPSAEAVAALDAAATARLRRHQFLTAAADSTEAAGALRRAATWLRHADVSTRAGRPTSALRCYAELASGVAETGVRVGAYCAKQMALGARRSSVE